MILLTFKLKLIFIGL